MLQGLIIGLLAGCIRPGRGGVYYFVVQSRRSGVPGIGFSRDLGIWVQDSRP